MKIIESVDQEYPRVFPLGAEDGLYLLLSHCPSVDSMGYFGQFASGMHSPWSPSQCLAGIKEVKFSKVSKYTLGRENGGEKKKIFKMTLSCEICGVPVPLKFIPLLGSVGFTVGLDDLKGLFQPG